MYFIDPRKKALIKKEYSPPGQGSGVIVSSQGHIITNFHVIAGSNEILIRDYNGNEYGKDIINYSFAKYKNAAPSSSVQADHLPYIHCPAGKLSASAIASALTPFPVAAAVTVVPI